MRDPKNDDSQLISRRNALKALVATGGATALSTLPAKWERPLLRVGALPVAAQVSPGGYSFSNEIESVTFSGPGSDQLLAAGVAGWTIVTPVNTTVGTQSDETFIPPGLSLPPWIKSRPWLKIKRQWGIVPLGWPHIITMTITIRFFNLPGFPTNHHPVNNTPCWFFCASGANLSLLTYYVVQVFVQGSKVICQIPLPGLGVGFYPFFISGYFPQPIQLLSGLTHAPGFYVGPGLYGNKVGSKFSSFLRKP